LNGFTGDKLAVFLKPNARDPSAPKAARAKWMHERGVTHPVTPKTEAA